MDPSLVRLSPWSARPSRVPPAHLACLPNALAAPLAPSLRELAHPGYRKAPALRGRRQPAARGDGGERDACPGRQGRVSVTCEVAEALRKGGDAEGERPRGPAGMGGGQVRGGARNAETLGGGKAGKRYS